MTEDSPSVTSESRKRKVVKNPLKPTDRQRVQTDADANPPGTPGLVHEDENEEAQDYQ